MSMENLEEWGQNFFLKPPFAKVGLEGHPLLLTNKKPFLNGKTHGEVLDTRKSEPRK
jgi:hypothetical protein